MLANADSLTRRYWQFLLYLFIGLVICELLLSPMPSIYMTYSSIIGYVGLSVEATLPLPQIYSNHQSRSCKGFRVSVLASWIAGDAMKMFWFFTATSEIPWAFKLCGIFQACCDLFLGVQYYWYGNGPESRGGIKDHLNPMANMSPMSGGTHGIGFGHLDDMLRRTPVKEKDVRLG